MQNPNREALQVEQLAERLKLVRGSLGFERQEDFAERLGRSRNSISAYERAKAAPDGETLMRIASLGINIQWLLTGEGVMIAGDVGPQQSHEIDTDTLADCIAAVDIFLAETRRGNIAVENKAQAIAALYTYEMESGQQQGEELDPRVVDLAIRAASGRSG